MMRRLHAQAFLLSAIAAVVGLAVPAGAQSGSAVDAGRIDIVDERGRRLAGGGSTTKFTFRIPPDEAHCPGDSQNGNYRVHSFMVPTSVQAPDVTYNGIGPTPQHYQSFDDFRMPLYDEFTADFTASLTAEAERLGGPGAIVNIPNLWFGVYAKGELPFGRYRIGLVCNHILDIEKYWDTEIEVTADDDDQAGFAWHVAGMGLPQQDSTSIGSGVLVGAAAVALGGVLVVLVRRRRARSHLHHLVGRR